MSFPTHIKAQPFRRFVSVLTVIGVGHQTHPDLFWGEPPTPRYDSAEDGRSAVGDTSRLLRVESFSPLPVGEGLGVRAYDRYSTVSFGLLVVGQALSGPGFSPDRAGVPRRVARITGASRRLAPTRNGLGTPPARVGESPLAKNHLIISQSLTNASIQSPPTPQISLDDSSLSRIICDLLRVLTAGSDTNIED